MSSSSVNLACSETSKNCVRYVRAVRDKAIFTDDRVIKNMLNTEHLYVPKCDYFAELQDDIQPFMRKVVTTWMLEVCEEQSCEEQILPLSINFMDRFLCVCPIVRSNLQLLGATCLLIASKLRSTNFLPVDLLCAYTDNSITEDMIVRWEQLVVSKLNYELCATTGYDYIDQVIERCHWASGNDLLRRHAHTLIAISSTETSLMRTRPSIMSAACLSSAVRGLKLSCQFEAINDICTLLNANIDQINSLINVVDNIVEQVANPNGMANGTQQVGNKTPTKQQTNGYESPGYGQPETPTEVENIYF